MKPVETQFVHRPQPYHDGYHDAQRKTANIQQTDRTLLLEISKKFFHNF
jgi:hypothetical protein